MKINAEIAASLIDQTLLRPTASWSEIEKLCQEAITYNFHSICINPAYVKEGAKLLQNSPVQVCTVVGFPLGANTSLQKARETEECLLNGAEEIDMVISLGAVKSNNWTGVEQELKSIRAITHGQAILKVILETGLLEEEEVIKACLLAQAVGVDFVKTSTGFLGEGATVEMVSLMKQTVGEAVGVKASGGIRDWPRMKLMLAAGATRIGTSNGVAIMNQLLAQKNIL